MTSEGDLSSEICDFRWSLLGRCSSHHLGRGTCMAGDCLYIRSVFSRRYVDGGTGGSTHSAQTTVTGTGLLGLTRSFVGVGCSAILVHNICQRFAHR